MRLRPVADLGAARLEGLEVRAARDLAELALARQPDLDVVGLGRAEADIPGRERHDAVVDSQKLQNPLGVARELLQALEALLGLRVHDQLDLVELVLADDAARVLAEAAGLGPEAWRVGRHLHRQLGGVEDLVAVHVRDRHLGGRDQVVGPLVVQLEEVLLELRQLSGPEERLVVDDDRRQHLGVAVLSSVQVEHEVHQRALEQRAAAAQQREPRPGDLGRAREVEDAERLAERDVVERLEVELRLGSPPPHLDVGRLVAAYGNGLVRKVRDALEHGLQLGVGRVALGFERLDRLLELAHLLALGVGLLFVPFLHELADLGAQPVALGRALAMLGDRPAAPDVELREPIQDRRVDPPRREPLAHLVEMVAHVVDVEHGRSFLRHVMKP